MMFMLASSGSCGRIAPPIHAELALQQSLLILIEKYRLVDEMPPRPVVPGHILAIHTAFRIAHLVGPGGRVGE